MTAKHFNKTTIIIILGGLFLVSTELVSQNEQDFRYVAYNDLLTTSSRYFDPNITSFSRLYIDVNKSIIIAGARDFLIKFSLQLDLMQQVKWEATKNSVDTCLQKGQNDCRNYIMAIHKFNKEILVCGNFAYSPQCLWRDIDTLNITRQEKSIGKSPFNPRSNHTSLVTKDGKMFVGSTIDFSGADPVILRSDLSNEQSKILRTKQYNELELNDPQFVGSFEHANFVYFVFREISVEVSSFGGKTIYSRIARVCKKDNGGTHIFRDNWTSFLKARLNCSISGGDFPFYFDEIQGISFLPDEAELYGTFATPENSIHGSAICVFNMSAIEKAFEGPIKYQEVPGSPIWHQKIIEIRDNYDCKYNHKSLNLIDSARYSLLDNSVQPLSIKPLYVAKLERLYHIAVTKISTKLHENVKVIFVSNEQGFIKKISVLPRTKEACVIELLESESFDTKIETMNYLKETQSLYIGTTNSVMKIPSQRCSRHLSKVSCINSMDPYCGWNDLTLACTTAPNNDPLIHYWYQNSTMCPILTVPVDGAFSSWSAWFRCAKTDNEIKIGSDQLNNPDTCLCRTRKCDNPAPKYGGKPCEGHTIQVSNCTVHGGWSEWSAYGACSQTCGVAIKVRKRSCTNPAPRNNGRTCVGSNQQEIYCSGLPPCPQITPTIIGQIDGQWSQWSDWSQCSVPCGKGYRIRERKCNNPAPQNNGLDCIGCNVEYEECNKQLCNEIKKFGPWTQWLIMNSSEYGHMEKRYRYMCKAPINDPSDLKISLFKEETRLCKKNDSVCQRLHLPNKASWGCWTDWSPCSVTSGKGRRVRYRKCLSSNGDIMEDKECGDGPSVQDEICQSSNCDSEKCIENENRIQLCENSTDDRILSSSIGIHWIFICIISFTAVCCVITSLLTKKLTEKQIYRKRNMGSPHYLPSCPNQYSSLPTKDYVENNKSKRQPSFSGSTSRSKVPNSQGTLTKSNNNLFNQNTPKFLKYNNDTDTSTMKRNSALNNMRLKQLEDDKDKY